MSGIDINWIDLAIVLIFAVSIIVGFIKGFFRSVVSIIVWIAAIAIAVHFGPIFSDKFAKVTSDTQTQLMLSYALLFMAVLIVGLLIKIILEAIINFAGLSTTDRIFGGLFGLFRGVFIVTVLAFLFSLTSVASGVVWQQSKLVPIFSSIVVWVEAMAPKSVQSKVAEQKLPHHVNKALESTKATVNKAAGSDQSD
ncbi:MAG: CvpA family protein [Gammaproteobacteria bacterium]|nr:CvpA family protein [Gammaproteobacteria bacterium]